MADSVPQPPTPSEPSRPARKSRPPKAAVFSQYVRHDDVEARLLGRRRTEIELIVADADDLYVIDVDAHFVRHSCSNIGQYGEKVLKMSARDAFLRLAIGKAMQAIPGLREKLLAGEMTAHNAASLGLITPHAHLMRDVGTWVTRACAETAKTFRREVDKAMREAEIQQPTVPVTLDLSRQGLANLEDAQALMSKAAGHKVSKSETVERSIDEWLGRHDPRRRGHGTRRAPPTTGTGTRLVPACVKRDVLDDAEGKCEIDLCDERIVEFVHLEPHVEGGDQEKENLGSACRVHHVLFDAGLLTVEIRDGERIWRGVDGQIIGRRKVRDAGPNRVFRRRRQDVPGLPRPGSEAPRRPEVPRGGEEAPP